jgi:hypothetical protein
MSLSSAHPYHSALWQYLKVACCMAKSVHILRGKKEQKTHDSPKQGIGDIVESNIPKDHHTTPPQHISYAREVEVANVGEEFEYDVVEHCVHPREDQIANCQNKLKTRLT